MRNRRRDFLVVLSGGGVVFPFTQDFSANASLGGWTVVQGSASVVAGALVITPTVVAELLTNGNMETWASATDAGTWAESIAGTSSVNREDADMHTGTYAARFDIDASNSSALVGQAVTAPAYSWIWASGWYKATNSRTCVTRIARNMYTTPALSESYAQYSGVQRTDLANPSIQIARAGTATSSSIYVDDVTAGILSLPSCGAYRRIASTSYQVLGKTSSSGSTSQWGVWICVDNPNDPQNGVLVWINRAYATVYLSKVVSGTWTDVLAAQAVTYGATKKLGANRLGETFQLMYGDVQVGADQTISDATIQSAQYCGVFSTDATQKFSTFELLPPFEFRFVWFSDLHVGDPTWQAGQVDAFAVNVNSRAGAFVVTSGDNILTTGDQTETDSYNASMAALTMPLYTLRGNHDGGQFTEHFVIDQGTVRIIAFYASYTSVAAYRDGDQYPNTGTVSGAELAWIEAQLQGAGGRRCILMGHWGLSESLYWYILPGYGREELIAMCNTYGVKAILSGHTHSGLQSFSISGTSTPNIDGAAAVGPNKYMVCDVYGNRIVITPYNAATPFAVTTPVVTVYT